METYFSNMNPADGTKEKLIQDLRVLVHDAEELIKAGGEKLTGKSRDELNATLERVKGTCRKIEQSARSTAGDADRLIRANPYQSAGIAFGVGLLLGALIGRK
jgi:ElaB/YqjD/DUF883 family membrane-anchored ribosome-binding protein